MELDRTTYNLTRKLYSDARRLVANATPTKFGDDALVIKADLDRLKETLMRLKNAKKED